MTLSREFRLAVIAIVLIALTIWLAQNTAQTTRARSAPLRSNGLSTITAPEVTPSSGLSWSRRHYPDDYAAPNRANVRLSGIDDRVNERFMDVGGRAYSTEFVAAFSYTAPAADQPDVSIEYLRQAETFVGRVSGHGLKPNFAYQLKLRGLPSEREAFERIGYLGRWRLPGSKTNFSDAEYREFKDKAQAESYLFFDFVVSDPRGNIEKEFYADRSLHVLYNATYQVGPRERDTRPIEISREGSDPSLYANPQFELSPLLIYAESEEYANRRPSVGSAFLPPGVYKAEFVLTEESFHEYGDGGHWATVMRAPVEFEVVKRPRPSLQWRSGGPVVTQLSLRRAKTTNIRASLKRTDELLDGTSVTDNPRIVFAEELDLPVGERYCLTAEVKSDGPQKIEVIVDTGRGFTAAGRYTVTAEPSGGWRRFEVEITSAIVGRKARIRLDPTNRAGRFAVRRVGVCAVQD